MKHKRRNKSSTQKRRKNNTSRDDKNDANPVEPDETNSGDLKGMKQWLESLTFESLVDALEFSFQADDDGHIIPGGQRQQKDNGGLSVKSGSHEFDLLKEMASWKCPDHIIGQLHPLFNDSESCYVWRRSTKAKLETPYLFRWVDPNAGKNGGTSKVSQSKSEDGTNPAPSIDNTLASLTMGTAGMPSELLDVLAQAGVKRSTSALLGTFNGDDEIDNAFESLDDCQNNMSKMINCDDSPLPTNFRVEADQWISNDGTSLGRGTTMEQLIADRSMMNWTAFVWDRTMCASEESNHDKSLSSLPRCRLNIADEAPNNGQQCKKLVLDTLRVASRGKFLSDAGKRRHQFLAPWFDPTQQWFSMPMYLVSRFEVSLWDAYYLQQSNIAQNTNESKENSLVQSVKNLDGDAIERVLCYAVGAVMKDEIQHICSSRQSSPADSISNSLVRKLLLWGEVGNAKIVPGTYQQRDAFASTPLLELDTPRSEFKSLVMNHMRMGLAQEAERSLLQSMQTEESKKSKTSKRKKKRAKMKGNSENQSTTANIEDVHSEDEQNSEDDDEPRVEFILPSTPQATIADYCETNSLDLSPQSESNVTKMTVLKVLDDILRNVLTRLGVQDDEFSDFTDAVTVKSRGESSQREFDALSVERTPRSDDVEVATTALMSNRAGASVDAAMGLLQRNDRGRNRSQSPVQTHHLWASRSRRQTHGGKSRQAHVSHLKRSKSSGDGAMFGKKPPVYPSKTTLPRSGDENPPLWPSSDSPLYPQVSQNETSIFDGAPLCLSGALDGWNSVACQKHDESINFTDLMKKSEEEVNSDDGYLASSTAASIASSRDTVEDAGLDIDDESSRPDCNSLLEGYESKSFLDADKAVHFKGIYVPSGNEVVLPAKPSEQEPYLVNAAISETLPKELVDSPLSTSKSPPNVELSPTPSSPPTPPPQLSPIIVSLADLGKLREEAAPGEIQEEAHALPPKPPTFGSTPKPPTMATVSRSLRPSLSREDLRSIDDHRKPPRRDRDDHHTMGHRQVDALLSYRNVVAQSAPRKPPSLKSYDGKQKLRDDAHPILARSVRSIKTTRSGMWPPGPEFPSLSSSVSSMPSYKEPILNKVLHLDVTCARSEGGLDADDDASHCNVIPRAQTDETMTKDGATTISSGHSPPEPERLATLKEERNSYRDMCLTLGAENAKLRNLLASKTCTPLYHPPALPQETTPPYFYHNDQQFWPAYNGYPNQFSTHSIVAMSDAGAHRGDYESSAMSEDGTDVHPSVVAVGESQNIASWQPRGDSLQSLGRRTSGGGTYAESDTSLDYNVAGQESHTFSGLHRVHQQDSFFGPIPLHGMQSRLSKDITRYMRALVSQLKKNEPQRLLAIKQLELSVKALWPRAQIKMYGSHVTKLCLPSSDIDFVISLPAVHKNAPAMAPGDLEGRNAIVETNQKVLARRLKSESWIDQRSIKVIERTAVPVIKVSTKDSRSRVVQLDLSFDAKEHHGLEALNMISQILEQMPMVRPLVLVLKQFLLDRGLLTAYTGGLSSYCLFLMVARYCQEQAPTWNDCGSLLMGLLDFYGNFFDPRTTGISVRTRQYFFRSQEAHSKHNLPEGQEWNTPHQAQFSDMTTRNSFSSKPHRFQSLHRHFSFQSNQTNTSQSQQFKSGKFDPMWVEDPLNPGNNVGRNAFRIFQVQRAFSDAHRALVASLEWDINSMHEFGDDSEYPLLKCLLQNEDVFISMDDPIHR